MKASMVVVIQIHSVEGTVDVHSNAGKYFSGFFSSPVIQCNDMVRLFKSRFNSFGRRSNIFG